MFDHCLRKLRIIYLCSFSALITSCGQIQIKESTDDALPIADNPIPKYYSDWHYESLPYCETLGTEVQDFIVPNEMDVWDRIRAGFAFEDIQNKRIQSELNWYSRHPSYFSRVSTRASRYMHYIVERLDERNMPLELALLPIVESAFDPFAYSHGRASGMWQIIPGTGKMLGLKQNWWYDGRRDVLESTRAALDYLESLNKRFDGDWMLALAAYNSGAGNVSKAIRRNKKKGKPTDYWSLDLPRETEGYVPKLLALKALVLDPDSYGITLNPIPNAPTFAEVDIGSQIDLAQAAELAELEMKDFYLYNPGFNRWATDPQGPHRLLVPLTHAENFKQRLAEFPSENRVTWDRYTIKSGDTLSTIAQHYKTDVALLQSINNIRGHNIRAGKTLLVPIAAANSSHYALSAPQRLQHRKKAGNGSKVEYKVQSGDSLWTISRKYKVSTKQIAQWNGMATRDPIKPGQTLIIWTKEQRPTQVAQNSGVMRKVSYRVRRGDSLARIASKFNIKVADIVSWNNTNTKKYLQPGDLLTLFVDVTKAN